MVSGEFSGFGAVDLTKEDIWRLYCIQQWGTTGTRLYGEASAETSMWWSCRNGRLGPAWLLDHPQVLFFSSFCQCRENLFHSTVLWSISPLSLTITINREWDGRSIKTAKSTERLPAARSVLAFSWWGEKKSPCVSERVSIHGGNPGGVWHFVKRHRLSCVIIKAMSWARRCKASRQGHSELIMRP